MVGFSWLVGARLQCGDIWTELFGKTELITKLISRKHLIGHAPIVNVLPRYI